MFSLPTGTEMFHFPALPPNWLYIHQQVTRHHSRRVSPFGHPRIHARLTAPRGITQPPTSFIGSRCQGIHHAPLNTYNTKNQKNKVSDSTRRETFYESKNSEIAHQHTRPKLCVLDARNHYPQIKHHTPPPRWSDNQVPIPGFPHSGRRDSGPVASKPNSVSDAIHQPVFPHQHQRLLLHQNHTHYRCRPISRFAEITEPPHDVGGPQVSWCSLERR